MNAPVTCPRCSSPAVDILALTLDGVLVEGCKSCGAFWEAELRECTVSKACDNCAWRPGSPERSDTEKWAKMMADFKEGAIFYCHKRVPARADLKGYSFDHQIEVQDGRSVCTNAPVCAGWLAWKLGQIYAQERRPPMPVNPCVYCHQGTPPPTTGYTRTCPACKRSYLARFPRDMMEQLVSGEHTAMSGRASEECAINAPNEPDQAQIRPNPISGDCPAAVSDVRQTAVQGSLF